MKKLKTVEYIWLDGTKPTGQIRSKTRIVNLPDHFTINDFPMWNFDGSSTNQATGQDSDCLLNPVNYVIDGLDNGGDYLVLCEVLNSDKTPHKSNIRSKLRHALDLGGQQIELWAGFEQEYTMFRRNIPLGWPEHGFPGKQGPYYCGVGSEQIFGRELANKHRQVCLKSGIMYYGMNAEVMPGQWEYQIGYRGCDQEDSSALNISDHMWIARWLMHRLSEEYNIHVSHDNKPVKGDWNGAGMHTNFSTKDSRSKETGKKAIDSYIKNLERNHEIHVKYYGDKLEERLTGAHETSPITQFSYGEANRGSSIRIPRSVADKGYGYIEDRRPGANADPYIVSYLILSSILGIKIDL
ncbi:MAG TPA: glutamine synthetase beta-grasp domain-containing protein [Candidatus Megaira endosymbiont of Nemacystus decipiens]|nr:glutamine synthetase beta-grasp domain-containing protein [Candidatus Megaera endosymbiont of Nemacystus decipiens]